MSLADQQRMDADRLIMTIKSAYWAALLIIAGTAFATYLFLQDMTASYQRDAELTTLAATQKTLSQRILFLERAARAAEPDRKQSLVDAMTVATDSFERNYDRLLIHLDDPRQDPSSREEIETILYGMPHHLDFFSTSLVANSRRFISAHQTRYQAGAERAVLGEAVASSTLAGYSSLRHHFSAKADAFFEKMLVAQSSFFFAIIAVICLLVFFIFRPMTDVIRRRTGELVDAHNSMAFIATHDGLTGLYNRTFLRDHFDMLIESAHRRKERLAVMQLDLDRFKQINDTLGHAAGDVVLVTTAERMRKASRASDVCVRLGGDEFVMVMPAPGSAQHMEALANRILQDINKPIVYQGATIFPGASAGIAVYPVDADDSEQLLVHADLALYAAKKMGGGSFSFFSDELRREQEYRKQLERDIAEAIENDAFQVYFQPQVSLLDGSIAGVEALVRWPHPEKGMISPGEFIPVAEQNGLMLAIGRIVMTKAIREAASWHREGIEFGRLAVNVSGSELRETDFTRFLFDTMIQEGLPAQKLALEIVESVILDDEKTGIASKLRMIRAGGVHLELDDFGTGYASLTHVNPNEIDRLKIDRRFVHNINLNDDNSKIVRAITDLARGLGISIVAEGAETQEELASLLEIGCTQVQGYVIAFPMPKKEFQAWLLTHAPTRWIEEREPARQSA